MSPRLDPTPIDTALAALDTLARTRPLTAEELVRRKRLLDRRAIVHQRLSRHILRVRRDLARRKATLKTLEAMAAQA